MLKNDEKLDDLQCEGLKVIQEVKGFSFGLDALALADFVKIKKNETAVELGTGCGVILFLLAYRSPARKLIGVEKHPEAADRARRSVALNNLTDKVEIIESDIVASPLILGAGKTDVLICNPPYFDPIGQSDSGKQIIRYAKHLCDHDLEEWIATAARLLKNGGRAYFVFTVCKMQELFLLLSVHQLAVKKMRFIKDRPDKAAKIFLLEARKQAKTGLQIEKSLVLHDSEGSKTADWKKLYHE